MEFPDKLVVSNDHNIRPVDGASRPVEAFVVVFVGMACAVSTVLFYDGQALALLVALIVAAVLFRLGRWEPRLGGKEAAFARISLSPEFFIACIVVLVLLPTLSIDFVSDDYGAIVAFHHLSLAGFFKMFHTDLATVVEGESGQEIRPLFALFYFLNYKLWGLNAFGYHISGICAHSLNALLVFRIAKQIVPGSSLRAVLAGLLFALHPVGALAVSWIAGAPAEIFPTLFYLLAFFFFICYRSKSKPLYLAASAASFTACLCIKEIAVTLPFMLVTFDFIERYRPTSRRAGEGDDSIRRPLRRLIPAYLPFAFLLVLYLAWRQIVFFHTLAQNQWGAAIGLTSDGAATGSAHFSHQVAHLGRFLISHYVFALRQLLLPFPWFPEGIVLGILLLWALLLVRKPQQGNGDLSMVLCFGLAWFLIADLPLLLAFPEARHLYLPVVGPCIAIAFCALPARLSPREPGYVRLASAAMLLVLAGALLIRREERFKQIVPPMQLQYHDLAGDSGVSPPPNSFRRSPAEFDSLRDNSIRWDN